jgi:hypothetical protein
VKSKREMQRKSDIGSVWQGSGSSKNRFGSDSFGGAAFPTPISLVRKIFDKTASPTTLKIVFFLK